MRACKASKLFLIVVVIHVVATVVVVVTVDVADVVADVVAVVSAVENACCCCCCGWQLKMSRMLSQLCQREKFRQAWAIYGIWWVLPYIYD